LGGPDTALGAFYRRLSARIGKAKAVTATARKIAVLFYNAVRHGMEYVDPGASPARAEWLEWHDRSDFRPDQPARQLSQRDPLHAMFRSCHL
jgi:hypothetical protein